jgi:outer membrane receptor protein involved in Fe transport
MTRHVRMHLSRLAGAWLLLTGLIVLSATAASAQTTTASLNGVVADPQQGRLSGVTVIARNQATLESREETTGVDGRFVFSQLPPGQYEVTAELSGFRRFRQADLTLRANQAADLPIVLEVGGIEDEVKVVASSVALDTRSANQSVTLTGQMVSELPQGTRTPFAAILGLAGTTTRIFGNPQNANQDQLFNGFALNGGRDLSSLILIDGAPATAGDWGGLLISPSPDSVQEMQVARNAYDAEFGRSGGGVVNLVTRGGSSEFRGGGWEFFRNDAMDANSWSNNRAGEEKQDFSRHQFGGQLGGPISKSKRLFFYGSFEGLRETFPANTGLQRVPTELERRGDFSQTRNPDGSLAVIYNPFTTRPDPDNPGQFIRDPFEGNRIPAELIDPVGAQVAALYPQPNRPGDPVTSEGNFFSAGTGTNTRDEFDTRVDWARTDSHTLTARVSFAPRNGSEPAELFGNGLEEDPIARNPRLHGTISNTFVPNSNWVINVLFGSGYWREETTPRSAGLHDAATIGLDPQLFQASVLPAFSAFGYINIGNAGNNQIRSFPRTTTSLQANATRQSGNHSLRFGLWWESNLINNVDRHGGNFYFNRGMTSGPIAEADSSTTGNGLASLLLGTGDGGYSAFPADMAASLRYYAGYVQDVWTVTDRLTVNAGLRYEIQRPATERFNRVAWFNPDIPNPIGDQAGFPVRGGFEFATEDDRGQWKQDWNDFAPRLGVAYKLSPKLVARAGYGIFYAATSALYTFDPVPGVSSFNAWNAANGFVPVNRISNPFPQGVTKSGEGNSGLLTSVGGEEGQVWLREPHDTPYKHQYSVDFQYQLNDSTVAEVGYSGFQGRNLLFGNPSNFNQIDPELLGLGNALNEQVPNPFFGVITGDTGLAAETVPRSQLLKPYPHFAHLGITRSLPGARGSFNALNLKLSRAFSDGLAVIATYQYSKNVDNASQDQGWANNDQWRDQYNKELERSVSAHDVPHSFAVSLIYEVPVGRDRKYGQSLPTVAEAILGGWQVSSIVRLASGYPEAVRAGDELGDFGFQVNRPNQVAPAELDDRTPENFFNPAAFQEPAPFTIGTADRYPSDLREEPLRNVDLSASKRFAVQGYTLEFRTDILNLFNHPQFGFLDTQLGSGTFGQANGTANGSRNVQIGLRVKF